MKFEIKVSGCPYKDREALDIFSNALDLNRVFCSLDEAIKSRYKIEEISIEEEAFLEELMDIITEAVN